MDRKGFLSIVNLIVIILLIIGSVVSYNFFKDRFSSDVENGKGEDSGDSENLGENSDELEDLNGESSEQEDLEIE